MSDNDCDICGNTIPFCDEWVHETYTRAWEAGRIHGIDIGYADGVIAGVHLERGEHAAAKAVVEKVKNK